MGIKGPTCPVLDARSSNHRTGQYSFLEGCGGSSLGAGDYWFLVLGIVRLVSCFWVGWVLLQFLGLHLYLQKASPMLSQPEMFYHMEVSMSPGYTPTITEPQNPDP